MLEGDGAGGASEAFAKQAVVEEPGHGRGKAPLVAGTHEETGGELQEAPFGHRRLAPTSGIERIADAADVGGDNGAAFNHRFKKRIGKPLGTAGEDKEGRSLEGGAGLVGPRVEVDPVGGR